MGESYCKKRPVSAVGGYTRSLKEAHTSYVYINVFCTQSNTRLSDYASVAEAVTRLECLPILISVFGSVYGFRPL